MTVRWSLSREGGVMLEVLDLAGRRLRVLERGPSVAGQHATRWDLSDDTGKVVSPGLYLVRISSDIGSATKRVLVRR
jgi:flagellar hook assembly protein FlgD